MNDRLRLPIPRETRERYNIAPTEQVLVVAVPLYGRFAAPRTSNHHQTVPSKPQKFVRRGGEALTRFRRPGIRLSTRRLVLSCRLGAGAEGTLERRMTGSGLSSSPSRAVRFCAQRERMWCAARQAVLLARQARRVPQVLCGLLLRSPGFGRSGCQEPTASAGGRSLIHRQMGGKTAIRAAFGGSNRPGPR